MRILIGRASARYSGRIEAEISLGDVVILLRDQATGGDGSCLLFDRGAKGVQPRNWMSSGTQIAEEQWSGRIGNQSGRLLLENEANGGERLEIFFERLEQQIICPGELTTEKTLLGTENEFSDLLSENLQLIDTNLTFVEREFRTSVGPIDILAKVEGEERFVAIEVKRRLASISTAYQVRRYLEALQNDFPNHLPPVAVIVAPRLARGAKEWLQTQEGISFYRLAYEDLLKL